MSQSTISNHTFWCGGWLVAPINLSGPWQTSRQEESLESHLSSCCVGSGTLCQPQSLHVSTCFVPAILSSRAWEKPPTFFSFTALCQHHSLLQRGLFMGDGGSKTVLFLCQQHYLCFHMTLSNLLHACKHLLRQSIFSTKDCCTRFHFLTSLTCLFAQQYRKLFCSVYCARQI